MVAQFCLTSLGGGMIASGLAIWHRLLQLRLWPVVLLCLEGVRA